MQAQILQYQKTFSNPNFAISPSFGSSSIVRNSYGEIYIAGNINSYYDFYLMKLDSNSNLLWFKVYDGLKRENLQSIHLTPNNKVILTCEQYSNNLDSVNILAVKVDSTGTVEWSKVYGSKRDKNRYTAVNQFGDIYFAGSGFDTLSQTIKFSVIKVDAFGNIIWANLYGGNNYDLLVNASLTNDGAIILCGTTWSYKDSIGNFNAYFVKVDTSGNVEWSNAVQFFGGHVSEGLSIIQTADGEYLSTIEPEVFTGTNSAIIKFDAAGNYLWNKFIIINQQTNLGLLSIKQLPGIDGYFFLDTYGSNSISVHGSVYLYSDTLLNILSTKGFIDNIDTNYFQIQDMVAVTNNEILCVGGFKSYQATANDVKLLLQKSRIYNSQPLCMEETISLAFDTAHLDIINGCNMINYAISTQPVNILSYTNSIIEFDLCEITGIEKPQIDDCKIYPNPVTNELQILFPHRVINDIEIKIINFLGQTIYMKKENYNGNEFQKLIDLSFLSNGIYLISIAIDGKQITRKIAKN